MKVKDCQEAYALGTRHGQDRRRIRGAYKLRQRRGEWQEFEDEVRRIARSIKHCGARNDLMHCTYEDKAYWLRKILLDYAYELGADILPSVGALTGDGLTDNQVRALMPAAQQACAQAIAILENARLQIAGNIQGEYRRMEVSQSVVEDALLKTRILLEGCITRLPQHLQVEILK